MGLFDYLRCEMPLPEPAPPADTLFQTKDVPTIQLYMEQWRITADGRLLHEECDYESNEAPDSLFGFQIKRINKREVEVPYHGDIGFGHYDSQTKADWGYVARFTEGRCTRIWLDEHTPALERNEPPAAPREDSGQ